MVGAVYIVGAGPGAADLLTLRAARLLQSADAVVYDRLVSPEILALVPKGAARIFAGKSCKRHHMTQEDIHATLLALARKKRCVVRLKGGDPLIFGRGGEEAAFLARHGIPYEIVPGISAASGCAAAAGIPLTHRDLASQVVYISGHRRQNGELDVDWQSLADDRVTVVCYMAVATAGAIADGLIRAGRVPDTPTAIIENGTTARQRRLLTSLCRLAEMVRKEQVQSPALLVIGRVVAACYAMIKEAESAFGEAALPA